MPHHKPNATAVHLITVDLCGAAGARVRGEGHSINEYELYAQTTPGQVTKKVVPQPKQRIFL